VVCSHERGNSGLDTIREWKVEMLKSSASKGAQTAGDEKGESERKKSLSSGVGHISNLRALAITRCTARCKRAWIRDEGRVLERQEGDTARKRGVAYY